MTAEQLDTPAGLDVKLECSLWFCTMMTFVFGIMVFMNRYKKVKRVKTVIRIPARTGFILTEITQ